MLGEQVSRSEDESSRPGGELTAGAAVAGLPWARAAATNAAVRAIRSLAEPCQREAGTDLRWVLLHLINETARHAGHADATREFPFDGAAGEASATESDGSEPGAASAAARLQAQRRATNA